jgi:hypothetical protein
MFYFSISSSKLNLLEANFSFTKNIKMTAILHFYSTFIDGVVICGAEIILCHEGVTISVQVCVIEKRWESHSNLSPMLRDYLRL